MGAVLEPSLLPGNFWETSGLNILETLARLDEDKMPELTDQLLSARTNISAIYMRAAIKIDPERVKEIVADYVGGDIIIIYSVETRLLYLIGGKDTYINNDCIFQL